MLAVCRMHSQPHCIRHCNHAPSTTICAASAHCAGPYPPSRLNTTGAKACSRNSACGIYIDNNRHGNRWCVDRPLQKGTSATKRIDHTTHESITGHCDVAIRPSEIAAQSNVGLNNVHCIHTARQTRMHTHAHTRCTIKAARLTASHPNHAVVRLMDA